MADRTHNRFDPDKQITIIDVKDVLADVAAVNFGYLEPRVRYALQLHDAGFVGDQFCAAMRQFDSGVLCG